MSQSAALSRLGRKEEMTRYDPDPNLPDSVAIDLIRLRPSIKRALLAAGFDPGWDSRGRSPGDFDPAGLIPLIWGHDARQTTSHDQIGLFSPGPTLPRPPGAT